MYMSLCPSRNVTLKLLHQDSLSGTMHSKDVMMGWDSDTTGAALGSLVASTQILGWKVIQIENDPKVLFIKKG